MSAIALIVALSLAGPPQPAAEPTPIPRATESPTASSYFDRAIAAVGPVDRAPFLRAIGTIETDGTRSELEVLWSARTPRRAVVRERLADGGVNETGSDGERGWMRVAAREGVREIEPAAVIATCAPLVPSLMVMAVADRFPTRTIGPDETLDGVKCRRIDLEDRDGLPGAAWFEASTGRLRAFRTQATRAAAPVTTTIETWMQAGPLTVPSRLVSRAPGSTVRTIFTRVETDAIADAAFRSPWPPTRRD